MSLILSPVIGIPLIQPGMDLVDIILKKLDESAITLADGDILVLAQKIISKSEGRHRDLAQVTPSDRAIKLSAEIEKDPRLVELILDESREVLRTRPGTIIVEHKLGFVCANAGIDHSNVYQSASQDEEWVLLLPENPDASADAVRIEVNRQTGKKIGVLIIDSHGRAWRNGVVGTAIGFAGIPGLVDLRGSPDLFGVELRITQVAAADELAAAASLMMGQAAEGFPVVHVRGFPYALREGNLPELIRPRELDLFR